MNYKGAYDSGTSYSVGDVVVYTDGKVYILKNPAPAGTGCNDTLYWNPAPQPIYDIVLLIHSTIVSINTAISGAQTGETNISKMIAPEYTKTTYSKGDIRTHEGKLYIAKQNIGTAEDWTSAHWDETTVGSLIVSLNAAAATIPTNISDEAITLTSGDDDYLITVDTTGEDPDLTVTKIVEEG